MNEHNDVPGHDNLVSANCCFCGDPLAAQEGLHPRFWGNNPEPLRRDDDNRCCDHCNFTKVIPARLERYNRE